MGVEEARPEIYRKTGFRSPAWGLLHDVHHRTDTEQAIARKIEEQISELSAYQQRHPEEVDAPSPFDVFCDLNPSDVNCRVYDD
jgi:hypothetical protein